MGPVPARLGQRRLQHISEEGELCMRRSTARPDASSLDSSPTQNDVCPLYAATTLRIELAYQPRDQPLNSVFNWLRLHCGFSSCTLEVCLLQTFPAPHSITFLEATVDMSQIYVQVY